jgi:teichuronic acid biosynthesis glycosyltransferase TuaG
MLLVSIIVPYYKKEPFIEKTISSILQQTYQNFEVLVINDEINSSTINFLEKIKRLDHRIQVIHNKKNIGAGESRNRGIDCAKGEFIAFCDSDDLWKKNKLEDQLNFMKKSDLDFSFTAYEIIDENENFIGLIKAKDSIGFSELRNSCDIGLSTVVVKRKIFENFEYRFAKIKTKEDYVLWLKLAKNQIRLNGYKEVLTSWRKNKDSLSSSIYQKLKDGYKVYRVYLKYGILRSLFCLMILSINKIFKK